LERQTSVTNAEEERYQHANRNECGQRCNEREPPETERIVQKSRGDSEPGCEQKNLVDPIHPFPTDCALIAIHVQSSS
jgi:hypothetical protein